MGMQSLTSRGIIGSFYHALEQNDGAAWVNPLSMLFQSNQESETYNWLGQSPVMREWIGGRLAKGLRANGITIANKKFEATLEIPADWMRRDKTGQIMLRINEMARRANAHWASLLTTLIINGESYDCYDGAYFFDTDHNEGDSGNQSNDVGFTVRNSTEYPSTTSKPSDRDMQDAILTGIEAIMGFVDDQKQPMNEGAKNFTVMIPLPFMHAAGGALGATVISGTANRLAAVGNLGGFNVNIEINPRLTWTTKLAVFRTDGDTAPFIRQEEQALQMQAIAEGSELEFTDDVHQYGIRAMRNVGYGYWQKACLVTFA
jgi:phage major head subunit gpT-like protein